MAHYGEKYDYVIGMGSLTFIYNIEGLEVTLGLPQKNQFVGCNL